MGRILKELSHFCACRRDHLSREPGTRSKLVASLRELLDAVKVLPSDSDYRRGLEATSNYRLKVCEANEQETAIEDVLDSHIEEVVQECFDEMKLIPYINGGWVHYEDGGDRPKMRREVHVTRAHARAHAHTHTHTQTHTHTHTHIHTHTHTQTNKHTYTHTHTHTRTHTTHTHAHTTHTHTHKHTHKHTHIHTHTQTHIHKIGRAHV